ncbi:tetratricopeptide repeat protein [Flavihumibacter sp. R14]|nr:tetratricopeptide repeat protein [Flavihumibacter soli]
MNKKLLSLLFIFFNSSVFIVATAQTKDDERLAKAIALVNEEQYDSALEILNKLVKSDPGNAKAYNWIGNVYKDKEDYPKALSNYNKATALDSSYFAPFNNRGNTYLNMGKEELALAEFTESIRLNPDFTSAWKMRGGIYFSKGLYDKAIEDFTTVISREPNNNAAYSYRADTYKSKGLYELAIKDCEESLRLDPKKLDAYYTIIGLLARTGNFTRINEYFEAYKVGKYVDNRVRGKFYRAYLLAASYLTAGDYSGILYFLNAAIEEKKKEKAVGYDHAADYSDVLSLKGYVLEKLNKPEEAKTVYTESLALNANQPEVRNALSLIGKPGIIAKVPEGQRADNTPPSITISSPSVSRGLKVVQTNKMATVKGHAADESGIYEITVNGTDANVDASGNFSASIPLAVGDNQLMVTATDVKMNKGSFNFTINRQPEAVIQAVETPIVAVNTNEVQSSGKYYALIIGIQDYIDESITDLDQPVADASTLYNTLITNYTFEKEDVILLKNPKRSELFSSLENLSQKVKSTDNLLIFYAGHGYWDEVRKQGYWFPSDAGRQDRSSWLTNADLKEYISAIQSKHTLLISDACFSGGIFKSRAVMAGASRAVKELYELPSRKAMTSGTLKEVPDQSVFIEYLVKRLQQNTGKYLSAEQLYSSMRTAVINNSANGQVPQFGEIKEAGDEGGDFIFIRKL